MTNKTTTYIACARFGTDKKPEFRYTEHASFADALEGAGRASACGARWTKVELHESTVGYAHITITNVWQLDDDGAKRTREPECTYYEKDGRKACLAIMPGNSNWGRSNAYMTPVNPEGRTRSYKNKDNARAMAVEFVLGK